MFKKALCLAAALAIAVTSTVAVSAQSYGGTAVSTSAASVSSIDPEEYAIENEDPQYGKYLDLLSQSQSKARSGSTASSGYTNNSLIHNSRFDGMDRVWGIDVSYFQKDIDWEKVKAAGINFAIIRVGYRGYGSAGTLVLDYKFKDNIQGAIDAGIEVGAYFFTQAITTSEAVAEADFAVSYLKKYNLDLPVYYDIESIDYDVGRLDSANLTKAQKTALCTAFCDRIIANGYETGVYSNPYWLTSMIDGSALEKKYNIWLANYTTKTSYTGLYNTWQFTGSGSISGISTAVDLNVQYRDPSANDTTTVAKVENFKLTPNGSKADLTWDSAKNAERYKVYRYNPTTKTYTNIYITTNTKASVTFLSGNYGYCVRGYKTVNGEIVYGDYSDIIYADKSQVTGLSATVDGTSVKLKWTAVTDAVGYEIYRSDSSSTSYSLCGEATSNSYTDSGLSVSTGYSYQVRACFGSGSSKTYGGMSDSVSAVTLPKTPSTPTYKSSDSTSITVSWNKLDNVSGYEVAIYNYLTKTYTAKATVSSSVRSRKITGLSSGTAYRIAVRGYVEYDGKRYYGAYSPYKTCYTGTSAPTNLYATVTPTTVSLKWDEVKSASKYAVYCKTDSGYTMLGYTTGTSYTTSKPTDASEATYAVKAAYTVGTMIYSSYSNEAAFSTETLAAPTFVSNKSGKNSVTLTWSKVNGAKGYRIYKYNSTKKTYVNIKTVSGGDTTSYTVDGLASGEACKFKIKAFTRGTSSIIWSKASAVYSASSR